MFGTTPDPRTCLAAVRSRDTRFDGWFVTAVLSTGIYCRPSCPAMTPREENLTFFASAAAAQRAGFRACKRCRPDASPGSPEWATRSDLAARAMRLIADGVVDRDGVAGLARRLGYSVRQVERIVLAELGAEPIALARAQRAQTARTLIESTALPMAEVAFAAGFASIRSFNDTVRGVYALTPTQLRARGAAVTKDHGCPGVVWHHVALRLAARHPFHPESALAHLVRAAVPGVEEGSGRAYRRTVGLPHGPGIVALTVHGDHVAARVWLTDLRDLTVAVARCRSLLDLDADPQAVAEHLGRDPRLRPWVTAAPGRRVPRTVDADELAVRAVVGQQVSVAAASTVAGRIVARVGESLTDPEGRLSRIFPPPQALAGLDPDRLGLSAPRARTVIGLATALADGRLDLGPGADWAQARERLSALPGIGPWTREMIALRGLGDPDAFPVGDLGVRRGLRRLGVPVASAEAWRPWRAYAVSHLWAASSPPLESPDPSPPRRDSAA